MVREGVVVKNLIVFATELRPVEDLVGFHERQNVTRTLSDP